MFNSLGFVHLWGCFFWFGLGFGLLCITGGFSGMAFQFNMIMISIIIIIINLRLALFGEGVVKLLLIRWFVT